MSFLVNLGDKIRKRRIELGMTQNELALRSGYTSRSSINKLELGHVDPSISKIYELSEALEMSPAELIFDNVSLYELSDREIDIVNSYRNDPELRSLIDKLLNKELASRIFYSAACSDEHIPDSYVILSADAAERLKNAPETDDPLM